MKRELGLIWKSLAGVQSEHVIRGIPGQIKELRRIQVCRQYLSKGAEVIFLKPKHWRGKWLLSLHGGPESYESLNELRYGGLYRALLKKGWMICIFNYRGSTQLKIQKKFSPWGCWQKSVCEDVEELIRIKSLDCRQGALLGGSFGGACALMISQKFAFKKTVLFSPLLDIELQIKRAGIKYQHWFEKRFSNLDRKQLSYRRLTQKNRSNVFCFVSEGDEVLGAHKNSTLKKRPPSNWEIRFQKTTHSPQNWVSYRARYLQAFEFLTTAKS